MNKAEQNITIAKLHLTEMHAEELDINALLAYAEDFIRTLENTWFDSPIEQKVKLQKLLFPKNVKYLNGEFTNSQLCPFFRAIEVFATEESKVVSREGFEPPTSKV